MCDNKNHTIQKGESLEHGEQHTKHHNAWSRRSFLSSLGVVGGSTFALGGLPISSLGLSPLTFASGATAENNGRILVMIRLKGGNDGLNTIIPTFNYGAYSANRPQLALPQNELIALDNAFAMHGSMNALSSMWNDGKMKVVNNVGYPDHNLSHFESIDIWSSGNQDMSSLRSGWLGRYYIDCFPDYQENPPLIPPAVKIGGPESILYYDENQVDLAINVANADELAAIADSGVLYETDNILDPCYYGEQLEFLRTMANSTFRYAEVISSAYEAGSNALDYSTSLGRQLSVVARMIKGNLGTQLYMVTLDGFDTHVNQPNQHANLLNNLSEAVNTFYADLEIDNMDSKVLTMTFSEFGRRVQQNASNGTDHGTVAPVLLFGPGLNGSDMVGDNPDLEDLDNAGNMKFTTDFRSIYSSVLEYWLCAPSDNVDMILGDVYDRIDLGFDCNPISSTYRPVTQSLGHRAYQQGGKLAIEVTLDRPDNLRIDLYTYLGQQIQTLHSGYVQSGVNTFYANVGGLETIPLVYRISNGKEHVSGKTVIR